MTRRRASRGITMIEMLIVLALIGLMSGIAWPSAMAALDGIRLRSTADSVASMLAHAALRVERRQQPVEIVIDREKGLITVSGVTATDRREFQLDPGISIVSIEPDLRVSAGEGDEQPVEHRFVFMPGAGWPALRIELSSPRGVRRIVRLDPITGAPDVRAPDAEARP